MYSLLTVDKRVFELLLIRFVLILIISRIYRFLSYGDFLVVSFVFLIVLIFPLKVFYPKLSGNNLIILLYFIIFAAFGMFTASQNILFYKLNLLLLCVLLVANLNYSQFRNILDESVFVIVLSGYILFFNPALYIYYDFNIVGDQFYTAFGINFPPTFSLLRAAASLGSSNELAAFLGMYLLLRRGNLNLSYELFIVGLILLSQSRSGLVLLLIYFLNLINTRRVIIYLVASLVATTYLANSLFLESILKYSRIFSGSEDASKSTKHRLDAIIESFSSGFFPWEGSNGTVTPHSVWFWHLDQFGYLGAFFLTVSFTIILVKVYVKSSIPVFLGVLFLSFTEPNMMLLPSIFTLIAAEMCSRRNQSRVKGV